MIKLVLPGSIRIKKNSKRIVKAGGSRKIVPSKAYKQWENDARKSIMVQLPVTWDGHAKAVHVQVRAFYRGKKPDLSGVLESVGDCCEGLIWNDDGQIESWDGSRVEHDKKNPRTEIYVWKRR